MTPSVPREAERTKKAFYRKTASCLSEKTSNTLTTIGGTYRKTRSRINATDLSARHVALHRSCPTTDSHHQNHSKYPQMVKDALPQPMAQADEGVEVLPKIILHKGKVAYHEPSILFSKQIVQHQFGLAGGNGPYRHIEFEAKGKE